jgi:hypothetical protein
MIKIKRTGEDVMDGIDPGVGNGVNVGLITQRPVPARSMSLRISL